MNIKSYFCTSKLPNRIMTMKPLFAALLFGLTLSVSSCNKTQRPSEMPNDTLPADESIQDGIMSIHPSHDSDTITWRGQTYSYEIERFPNDTLPKVVDEDNGTMFYDNQINLTIKQGTQIFFKHSFFKSTFNKFLDEAFQKNSILEGMVFVGVQDGGLEFATSICYPHSDLYVPLLITIAPNGTVSIQEDKIMDTSMGNEEEP